METLYPYIPHEGAYIYVPQDNLFMYAAMLYARDFSQYTEMPVSCLLVRNNLIIGMGANGSDYHERYGCRRRALGIPPGEQYEECEGCTYKQHAEIKAIQDAKARGAILTDISVYVWGHWWACEPCWHALQELGVSHIYLLDHSEKFFNPHYEGNIIGKQYTYIAMYTR